MLVGSYYPRNSKSRIGTRDIIPEKSNDHLIFTLEFNDSTKPTMLYSKLNEAFHQLLESIDQRKIKEGSYSNRGKITLNSFRRFVRTTLSDQTNTDYAEWFIGHAKSTYWTKKPEERKEIYLTKCMKALTFLDFSGLETRTKNIETQMQVLTEVNRKQEGEIEGLKHKDIEREDILQSLVKAVNKLRVDKDRSDKKMKEVTNKLREIELEEERAQAAWMDKKLRREFYQSAEKQLAFLQTLGKVQMEKELEKSLKSILKRPAVLDESKDDYRREENVRELVQEVLHELRSKQSTI